MEALHVWDHHGGCSSRINFKLGINTDHLKLVLKRYNSHRGRASLRSLSISTSRVIEVVRCLTVFHGQVMEVFVEMGELILAPKQTFVWRWRFETTQRSHGILHPDLVLLVHVVFCSQVAN